MFDYAAQTQPQGIVYYIFHNLSLKYKTFLILGDIQSQGFGQGLWTLSPSITFDFMVLFYLFCG